MNITSTLNSNTADGIFSCFYLELPQMSYKVGSQYDAGISVASRALVNVQPIRLSKNLTTGCKSNLTSEKYFLPRRS